jgi:aspartate racemase
LPYDVDLRWSETAAGNSFDVILQRRGEAATQPAPAVFPCLMREAPRLKSFTAYANNPLRAMLGQELVPQLRHSLSQQLPDYMVPSAFVTLEALPLTPQGKLDRGALPDPDFGRPRRDDNFAAPQDEMARQLTEIWEKVFGIQPIGVRDNFFDLGGHSLLAVRLFKQIEKTLGKSLPLATLFQAPTIEQLADVLRRQAWSASWSSLVPIQTQGSLRPFYLISGGGGNVLTHSTLAPYLGTDFPFYGLQSLGLDGKQEPLTRLEEIAARFIKEIRAFQPEGPYFLGGFSFGGKVAFEMAQQLHAQDQKVGLLAMLDATPPGRSPHMPKRTRFRTVIYFLIGQIDIHRRERG